MNYHNGFEQLLHVIVGDFMSYQLLISFLAFVTFLCHICCQRREWVIKFYVRWSSYQLFHLSTSIQSRVILLSISTFIVFSRHFNRAFYSYYPFHVTSPFQPNDIYDSHDRFHCNRAFHPLQWRVLSHSTPLTNCKYPTHLSSIGYYTPISNFIQLTYQPN